MKPHFKIAGIHVIISEMVLLESVTNKHGSTHLICRVISNIDRDIDVNRFFGNGDRNRIQNLNKIEGIHVIISEMVVLLESVTNKTWV